MAGYDEDPDPEFEAYLDEITGIQSTPEQRRRERAMAELMLTGKTSYEGFDLKLHWDQSSG